MSDFGEKVRGYRKKLGVTQKALAEAAGLTPTYFNRMEKGNRKVPRVETVLALVKALHRAVRLTLEQAEELVQLAGYSPEVLRLDGGLALTTPGIVHDAKPIPAELLGTIGEHIDGLIASGGFSKEEKDEVASAIIEMIKRFRSFKEAHRKMHRKSRP
jgi:transcriptional regulator with XRE-family HTH domain